MVWPSSKTPTGLRYDRTLDRTILGRYRNLDNEPTKGLWLKRPASILAELRTLDHWRTLPVDVLDKYSKSDFRTVRRIVFLWRGLEANFLAANPNLLGVQPVKLHLKLWRWCITAAIHSYDSTCKEWKKVCLHLLQYCGQHTTGNDNPFPYTVPGGVGPHMGPLWFEMFPFLKSFAMMKVVSDETLVKKSDVISLGYIIQTRVTPPPPLTNKRFEAEYIDLLTQRSKIATFSDAQKTETSSAMMRVKNYLDKLNQGEEKRIHPRPHLSLSGSGCYELPRTLGGRAMYIMTLFLEKYVSTPAPQDLVTKTWWDAPYVLNKGEMPYKTICRSARLDKDILFLCSAFRDEMAPDGLLASTMSAVNSHMPLEEPMFGLDSEFPHSVLQCCVETCVNAGYLPGPATKWTPKQFVNTDFKRALIPAKSIFQGESGNKVRVLAEGPAAVTICLQPFAHWLSGIIQHLPSLRSAFTRSFKGWDLAVSLMRTTDHYIENGSGFSVFDLTGASNGLNRQFMRHMGMDIIYHYSDDPCAIFYFTQMLELLLAPKRIEIRKHHSDTDYRIIVTSNGLDMGDPGTKEFLCLTGAVIELMVYRDVKRPPLALIAGDDIGAVRTVEKHNAIIEKHIAYGNEINRTKTRWSRIFMWFCEEMLFWNQQSIGCGRAPWQVEHDESIHCDVGKMRLLSPFCSVGEYSDRKNPASGKGDLLWNFLTSCKEPARIEFLRSTFFNWMSSYISSDPLIFLPRVVGGFNIPYNGNRLELYDRIIGSDIGPLVCTIFANLKSNDEVHPLFSVLTRRMSSGNEARGLLDPMSHLQTLQYATIAFGQFQDEAKTLDQFKTELQATKTYNISYGDAIKFAKKSGYTSYGGIADNLDRMTAMRNTFTAAAGLIPLEDIIPDAKERIPSPSEILSGFMNQELPSVKRFYGIPQEQFNTKPEHVQMFRTWVLSGCPNFLSRTVKLWIPQAAVTNSMNAMTVHMPYRKPKRPVPGSVDDEHRDPHIEGYAPTVISRRRLK